VGSRSPPSRTTSARCATPSTTRFGAGSLPPTLARSCARAISRTRETSVYEWSDAEIEAVLSASRYLSRQPEARQDYSRLLGIAVFTGLRLGELLGLEWGDVDLGDKPVLHVRRQWTKYTEIKPPKTKKGVRRVPLWPEAVETLRALRVQAFAAGRARSEDPVFTSRNGERLGHRNVQRRGFEAARDHAELPESLTFHSLRHAFASLAKHRGVPLDVLSAVMGHSTISVTQNVYIHLYGREEAEEAFRQAGVAR
jgi:integrase